MDDQPDKRRGRPAKFGRPSRVVALTLPEDAIERLRRVHKDLGWAIVKLLDTKGVPNVSDMPEQEPDVELVTVADRRSLIVVNREVIRDLPGVNIIPSTQAARGVQSGRAHDRDDAGRRHCRARRRRQAARRTRA